MNNTCIQPRIGKVAKWQIGTFDLETVPEVAGGDSLLGKFSLGATCLDGTVDTVVLHKTPLSMLSTMLSYGDKIRWYAHNGGNFDFKYILNDDECKKFIADKKYSVKIVGGKIAKALMFCRGKKTIFLCDSYKLMNEPLKALCYSLDVEVKKGNIDFENGEIFDINNMSHIQYLENDVICLWQVMAKYRKIINTEFGSELKCTASSTAFAAWQVTLQKAVYKHSSQVNTLARNSYYGGRTELYYQGISENVNYIDVNSLYAYIMYEFGTLHRPVLTDSYDGPGFYRIKADVPDGKFGLLPKRADNGGLCFPTGKFETTCSSLEIDFAIANGANIEIIDGVCFQEWDKELFKPFIKKCQELRSRDYSGALGKAAKFMQNNLYGFFGMKPERDELIYSAEYPGDEYSAVIDRETGDEVENLWTMTGVQDTINCIPAFAAWITSAARVHLLTAMLAEERAGNTVVYCDTDSIFMLGEPVSYIRDGEYGAFKLEMTIPYLATISAKTYCAADDLAAFEVETAGKSAVKVLCKCKGVPKRFLKPVHYGKALKNISTEFTFSQLNSLQRTMETGRLGTAMGTRSMPIARSITSRKQGKNGYTQAFRFD